MATKKKPQPGRQQVTNPVTGEPLRKEAAEYVTKIRTVRTAARKAARSGHPGRRADGQRALANTRGEIRRVFLTEATR